MSEENLDVASNESSDAEPLVAGGDGSETRPNVSYDDARECDLAAEAAADDREDPAVEWSQLIELPIGAFELGSFSDRVGEQFDAALGQRTIEFVLEAATSSGEAADLGGGTSREPFTLLFSSRDGNNETLPEGIYALEHAQLGRFEIQLEPVGSADADGDGEDDMHMQATFG